MTPLEAEKFLSSEEPAAFELPIAVAGGLFPIAGPRALRFDVAEPRSGGRPDADSRMYRRASRPGFRHGGMEKCDTVNQVVGGSEQHGMSPWVRERQSRSGDGGGGLPAKRSAGRSCDAGGRDAGNSRRS